MAHINVKMSPNVSAEENFNDDIIINPIKPIETASTSILFNFIFTYNNDINGNKITYMPVINPDCDDVVYFNPTVWK